MNTTCLIGVGDRVRATEGPFRGMVGTVLELHDLPAARSSNSHQHRFCSGRTLVKFNLRGHDIVIDYALEVLDAG